MNMKYLKAYEELLIYNVLFTNVENGSRYTSFKRLKYVKDFPYFKN
jgi:hypothetical protein